MFLFLYLGTLGTFFWVGSLIIGLEGLKCDGPFFDDVVLPAIDEFKMQMST